MPAPFLRRLLWLSLQVDCASPPYLSAFTLCCFPFQERFLRQTVKTYWWCLETLWGNFTLLNSFDTSCHYSKDCCHLLFYTSTPPINLNSARNWARLSTEPQLTSDWWTHIFYMKVSSTFERPDSICSSNICNWTTCISYDHVILFFASEVNKTINRSHKLIGKLLNVKFTFYA